jgi:spore germination protein PC
MHAKGVIALYDWHNEILRYLQQLNEYIKNQDEKLKQSDTIIQQLRKQMNEMQVEINQLKQKPFTNIERVEYKFDQLKVETLEGTLNIGFTPGGGPGEVEDFVVTQGSLQVPPFREQQIVRSIQSEMEQFMIKDCYEMIENIEKQYGKSLDASYRRFIIEDINRQIPNRIEFYMKPLNMGEMNSREGEQKVIKEVIEKVKKDIENALHTFIGNLPNNFKGGNKE